MTGVQYIVDEKGRKTAVVIDLRRNRAAWEDFRDAMLAREREDEPRETLDSVRQRLVESGRLDGA